MKDFLKIIQYKIHLLTIPFKYLKLIKFTDFNFP